MAKSMLLHPQFFHTLVHGFHTHLMIPVDFFSKYVEGKSVVEKTTAELRSDSSDIAWKVKMTGRRLSDGWEEFAVANNLQTGDVVVVRYEGDMVFHVSDLGPNCCDITVPSNNRNDGQDDIGNFLLKKHTHPRTDVGDDDEELPRKKKVKKNSVDETEAVSSSLDNSCFVANVTASNLCSDTLYLPQHFTSSNGLTRNCHKIVLIDGGERSWALDLMFEESSDTFYISRGWTSFCDENGEKAGGFFTFKLVGNGETPVLSFNNNRRHGDCSEASRRESLSTKLCNEEEDIEGERNGDECKMEIEKKKYIPKRRVSSYASYSPYHKRSVTFKLPPDYDRIVNLSLPTPFVRENGINKPGEMYLLGKDGTKWPTNLLLDKKGTMRLGKGWKDFVKVNGLNTGESFTLKLIWEDTIPMLSLCCAESTSDREQEEYFKTIRQSLFIDPCNRDKISRDENTKEESRSWERNKNHLSGIYSTPSSQKQLVTLTITPSSVRQCKLRLPNNFTRDNDIHKPGMITLLGKDGIKQQTKLLFEKERGCMALGNGWKDFAKENSLKTGDSFTLKLIWEDTKPVLSLCPAECSIDRGAGGGCSVTDQKKSLPIEPSSCEKLRKDENSKEKNNKEENRKKVTMSMEREKNHLRGRDSTPSSQKQFVTLKITPSCFSNCKLTLPAQFARENSINKPGMVYLLGKDGTKWMVNLVQEKDGRMNLGKGLKDFAKANDLKTGESFTMELIWEDGTCMLRLVHLKSSSSKANEKESISTEPRSRDSSLAIQNRRTVTLTLTPEDVRACKLHLPSQFMRANGINKLGKITLLGENEMEWSAYLLSIRDGTVALENGWDEFCEANGVKLGESFTLEFVYELDTVIVLKFCSRLK